MSSKSQAGSWSRRSIALLTAALALPLGCTEQARPSQPDAAVESPRTLALVAGQAIEIDDALKRVNEYAPSLRRQLRRSRKQLRTELDKLIEEALIVAVARERGYERDPRIQQLIRQYLVNLVRDDVFAQVKLDAIEETQIRAAYEQARQHYSSPLRLRAAHIQLGTQEEALALLKQARKASAARFAALAREHSLDRNSAKSGGDLGWLTAGPGPRPRPLFVGLAMLKQPGEVGGPVRSAAGWHIIRLAERVEPAPRPYQEVREQVRQDLFRQQRKRLYQRFVGELKDKFTIRRFDERLDELQRAISE